VTEARVARPRFGFADPADSPAFCGIPPSREIQRALVSLQRGGYVADDVRRMRAKSLGVTTPWGLFFNYQLHSAIFPAPGRLWIAHM